MRSLRNRIIVSTLTATLIVLFGAAALVYGMIRAALVAEFDETLLAKAKAVAAVAEEDEGRFELDLNAAQMPEFQTGDDCEYFQIWNQEGVVLARSPSLVDHSLEATETETTRQCAFTTLPDGRPGRQMALATPIRTDHDAEAKPEGLRQAVIEIAVARDISDLNHSLGQLAVLLGVISLGAALASLVVLVVVIRFSLKPVAALAAQIAAIDALNVSGSGEVTCSIEELDPVVDRLNELLERLNMAFTREKAFTADVAHELRTPLAGLSTALEVCSSRTRDAAAYQDVILKCLGATQAMQSMVENLLTLARADAGQLTLQTQTIDLSGFATESWRPYESQAAERELQVDWSEHGEPINIVTDPDLLRVVFSNFFDNAVRHSNRGGTITVKFASSSEKVAFEICNSGCELSPADAGKVFERFWKHDTARTEGARHCGLGLPLCHRIADVLGGSVTVSVHERSFSARLVLMRCSTETAIQES